MHTEHIITTLMGGLGNQMFQYAAGLALALRHNVPLLLDLTWYDNMTGYTPRCYCLDIFPSFSKNIDLVRKASAEEIVFLKYKNVSYQQKIKSFVLRKSPSYGPHVYVEPPLQYWKGIEEVLPPAFLEGFWQSVHYFQGYENSIRRDFVFPLLHSEKSIDLQSAIICCTNSVALHVRRGDYASIPTTNAVHGLCPPEYYAAALAYIKKHVPDAHIFIFSDDPVWVRANFDMHGLRSTVVDAHGEHDAHHDMHLMTLCRHHIIANSSFSWWGAWPAPAGGLTIAPKQWYADPTMAQRDPCPERWLRL